MSKVITFSTKFPSYHPKAGQPTFFIEKIWASFHEKFPHKDIEDKYCFVNGSKDSFWDIFGTYEPKYHTVRAGNRWKVGDKFSPRAWTGKPYNSKQLTFAPDLEIKKTWEIETNGNLFFINGKALSVIDTVQLANNDGLLRLDFYDWFKMPSAFSGQIICWSNKIEY